MKAWRAGDGRAAWRGLRGLTKNCPHSSLRFTRVGHLGACVFSLQPCLAMRSSSDLRELARLFRRLADQSECHAQWPAPTPDSRRTPVAHLHMLLTRRECGIMAWNARGQWMLGSEQVRLRTSSQRSYSRCLLCAHAAYLTDLPCYLLCDCAGMTSGRQQAGMRR